MSLPHIFLKGEKMAKLAARIMVDLTMPTVTEQGLDVSPSAASVLEAIIAAGCVVRGCTYERLNRPVVDDGRLNHVYEITETP